MKLICVIIISLFVLNPTFADDLSELFKKGQKAYSEKNYKLAHEIWEDLAKNNYTLAQSTLGYLYAKGLGVDQNYVKSAEWIKKAAENGELQSMYNLAGLYMDGLGVEKSYKKAEELYRSSLLNGFKVSIAGLITLYGLGEIQPTDNAEKKYWEQEAVKLQDEKYVNKLYYESGLLARPQY